MNKYLHAMRNWRGQLVLFDEVDVSTMIEVEFGGRKQPMGHIFRAVKKRTHRDINDEMRTAQAVGGRGEGGTTLRKFVSLPRFMRAPFYWLRDKNPRIAKQYAGTVALTAIGMFEA
jgi:hypothetical protein